MNTKERIIHGLHNPSGVVQLAGSMAERYLHLPKRTYPYTLQIHLDSVCNIKCFFCAYEGRQDKPGRFDMANLDKLEQAIRHCHYLALSAWGDPLCSPHLEAVLEKIYSWNSQPYLIAIVTNGINLSPELAMVLSGHLADLTISINAATPGTYERDMRGGRWDRLMAAIRSFMSALKPADVGKVNLHFVAHGRNHREIPQLADLADDLGIQRIALDQFTVNTQDNIPLSLLHHKQEYNMLVSVLEKKAWQYGISVTAPRFTGNGSVKTCHFPWMFADVWADGRVAPCCCNGSLFMGNAYDTSFENVWFGDAYNEFRRHGAPQCDTCPMIRPFDNPWTHVSPYLAEVKGMEVFDELRKLR